MKRAGTTLTKGTMRVTLLFHGSFSCSAQKVPLCNPVHTQAHVKFARDHVDEPQEDWEKVIWSDATITDVFGINTTLHVWKGGMLGCMPGKPCPLCLETSCVAFALLQRGHND